MIEDLFFDKLSVGRDIILARGAPPTMTSGSSFNMKLARVPGLYTKEATTSATVTLEEQSTHNWKIPSGVEGWNTEML